MNTPNSNISRPNGGRAFNERRGGDRQRALKGGLLRFNGGYGTMECVVRNISPGGARLSFGDAVGVPGRFELRIGTDGEWRPVRVTWRKGDQVGVAFE